MTAFVLVDANVYVQKRAIGGTLGTHIDLTEFIMSATLNYSGDLQESTAMGGDRTRRRLSGLIDWGLEMTMKQDFDADGPDSVLFDLVGNPDPTFIQVTANGDPSNTNPRYWGLAVLSAYTPLGGGVGELSTTPANFMASGPLVRDNSAFGTFVSAFYP